MSSGGYEPVLETLSDLDARLAGLEVGYSAANATAAREHVATLSEYFTEDPDALVALREAVETIVENEDAARVDAAKDHADDLKRQIEAKIDDETGSESDTDDRPGQ